MAHAFVGVTGVGKTYTLHKTLLDIAPETLFIRSLEDLIELEESVTDIIFDDISFELSRPELLIHLCDKDFYCPVRILRRSVRISPEIRKWFTHNCPEAFRPVLASLEQQDAIDRRLTVHRVSTRKEIRDIVLKYGGR